MSSPTYAALKGRPSTQPAAPSMPDEPPEELSLEESERVQANKDFVCEHMPELIPFIRDLHAEGMIDGWRAVKRCRLLDQTGNE